MWSAVVIIVALSGYVIANKDCLEASCSLTCETDAALSSIGGGFSVYSFAFSVHASLPNFFSEMDHSQIFRANTLAYSSALLLFGIPLLTTTYLAFGRAMLGSESCVFFVLFLI